MTVLLRMPKAGLNSAKTHILSWKCIFFCTLNLNAKSFPDITSTWTPNVSLV